MANNFYTPTGSPATSSAGASSVIRAEFASIEDGFDKMPTITGNALEYIRVNSTPDGLEAVAKDASGTIAGLTAYKINMYESTGTHLSFMQNSNSATRTYTFQDRNGTISDDTDLALKANIASPTFTGVPAAPTAALSTDSTQIATTAFVQDELALKANLASPPLTGVPTAPTAAASTSTNQIATTAFVQANSTTNFPNLLINSDFAVNQEAYAGGVIATGDYGHDMWQSGSTPVSYTVSSGALTIVSGFLYQKNDELVAVNGSVITLSVESGSISIGSKAGATNTVVTSGNSYSWTLDHSLGFITFVNATAAYGIKIEIGGTATAWISPEPVAELNRCLFYYRIWNGKLIGYGSAGTATSATLQTTMGSTVSAISASGFIYADSGNQTFSAASVLEIEKGSLALSFSHTSISDVVRIVSGTIELSARY